MRETGATRPRLSAFAPTDCHTCLSRNRKCQRQRPYCSTCSDCGIKCGGYATVLSWHASRTYSSYNAHRHQQASRQVLLSPRQRKGTDGNWNGARRGNIRNSRSTGSTERSQASPIHSQGPEPSTPNQHDSPDDYHSSAFPHGFTADCFVEDFAGQADDGLYDLSLTPVELSAGQSIGSSNPRQAQDLGEKQCLTPTDQDEVGPLNISAFSAEPSSLTNFTACYPVFDPANIKFGRINLCTMSLMPNPLANTVLTPSSLGPGQQRETLLRCYDEELCVLPLTSDLTLNPFRVRGFKPEASQLLLHSIMALYSQHQVNLGIGETSAALEHRSRASEFLTRELQNWDMPNGDSNVLPAILILITLDCTISASGNWSDHIGKAKAVLEAWGGLAALKSPLIRSQVSMLVWWDATLALISRKGAMFPASYFEYLVQKEEQDGWSFYDLTGCPTELLILLIRLVEMARQKELAASLEYLTFPMEPILDIEQKLLSWKNIFAENSDLGQELEPRDKIPQGFGSSEAENSDETNPTSSQGDEEDYYQQKDRYHLAEAWRYALLLYTQRVFKWDRQSHRRQPGTLRLTCSVLEHARNCRKTSQAQKQLLLPIFFAGAEARNEDMRNTVRDFCHWWGARSRYGMFYSVSTLLEEYWTEAEAHCSGGNPIWWGSFLDEKASLRKAGGKATQFLFG